MFSGFYGFKLYFNHMAIVKQPQDYELLIKIRQIIITFFTFFQLIFMTNDHFNMKL